MPRPTAVLISDVHYNIQTLPIADKAMRLAIAKANELDVPLIVAGDLHDTKANMRAECVNAMLDTLKLAYRPHYDEYGSNNWETKRALVLVGNHDKINEKSNLNALEFLSDVTELVDMPRFTNAVTAKGYSLELIPYQSNPDDFRARVRKIDKKSIIICHQGITGSKSGEYIQDHSAINPEDVAGRRVISGHYHQRQTIALPDGGTWDYIGNPYTLNFGEADDPEKGFQILMNDGSLEFVPTNLRRHHILEVSCLDPEAEFTGRPDDLLWVKVSGPSDELAKYTKDVIANQLGITQGFRLDMIPTDSTSPLEQTKELPQDELFDSIIDSLTDADNSRKARLKALWKDLVTKE